jgi:DNA-directed RNA polymerase subunit alpha
MLDTFVVTAGGPDGGGVEPVKPEIRVLAAADAYGGGDDFGQVAVEPLERGFGQTIGNPLRRILLSSTPGTAVTWVRIEDVVHEYMAIPGVKEEVMELLLNIKGIRIRSAAVRQGKMRLNVRGEGRVCAGDIETSPDLEIVNPELHLATLDGDDTGLSIEFNVEQGVGYRPAQPGEDGSAIPTGALPVDAVFSPVRKVNFKVEPTRVGQNTNYERLLLEVWTDGAIKPVEAVQQAAEKLVEHFFLFSKLSRAAEQGIDRMPRVVSPEVYQTPIEKLELSPRTLNCLKRAQINRVGEVLELSDEDLLKIRNFGEKSLYELHEKLAEHGITSGRPDLDADESTADTPSLSAADLDELMGGGADVDTLPSGMTFEEPSESPHSSDDSNGIDFSADDYDE